MIWTKVLLQISVQTDLLFNDFLKILEKEKLHDNKKKGGSFVQNLKFPIPVPASAACLSRIQNKRVMDILKQQRMSVTVSTSVITLRMCSFEVEITSSYSLSRVCAGLQLVIEKRSACIYCKH